MRIYITADSTPKSTNDCRVKVLVALDVWENDYYVDRRSARPA